jgi:hypothetical protein
MTSPGKLAVEAVAVGVALVVLFFAVHAAAMRAFGDEAMTNHLLLAGQVALSGAAFHVLCEVAGVNEWYCAQRDEAP